jgi:hypothetical protein
MNIEVHFDMGMIVKPKQRLRVAAPDAHGRKAGAVNRALSCKHASDINQYSG